MTFTTYITAWSNTDTYSTRLKQYMQAVEGEVLTAYVDGNGVPTIGWGFAINSAHGDPKFVNWFIRQYLGINNPTLEIPSPNPNTHLSATAVAAEKDFYRQIRAALDQHWAADNIARRGSSIALETKLNDILLKRIQLTQMPNSPYTANDLALIGTPATSFQFYTANDIPSAFDNHIAPDYESVLTKIFPGIPGSDERIALFSLLWQGKISPPFSTELKKALGEQNPSQARADAWYTIRYLRPWAGTGDAWRNYVESAMFGLYNNSNNVTTEDAKAVYRMFALNRSSIRSFDAAHESDRTGANDHLAQAYGGSVAANTITQDLTYARTQILGDLASNGDADIRAAFSKWNDTGTTDFVNYGGGTGNIQNLDPLNIFVDPERRSVGDPLDPNYHADLTSKSTVGGSAILIGAGTPDPNKGATLVGDTLTAGSGNDLMIGGAGNDVFNGGTGKDVMAGGLGNDDYYIKSGATATIEDHQGVNRIFVGGKLMAYFYTVDGVTYKTNDGNYTGTMNGGDFIVTYTDPSTHQVTNITLNQNFQSGDFGITLLDHSAPFAAIPNVGGGDHNIYGDYNALLDGNGNIQYDSLGNVMGNLNSPHPDQNDMLFGSASGNDFIDAGGGYNSIKAGDGNNTLVGGSTDGSASGNTIVAGNGNNDITLRNGNAHVQVGNGNNGIVAGGGQDILIAGNGNNRIYANQAGDLATVLAQRDAPGGAASGKQGDLIAVGTGNNTIVGSNGNDLIFTAGGHNTVVMGNGANSFWGGVTTTQAWSGWTVTPFGQGEWVTGTNAQSSPFANPPSPYNGAMFGGAPVGVSNDTIYGGNGDSRYILGNGNNWLDAGNGNDIIGAGTGSSTIFAGSGNDSIYGSGGSHYITLGDGNDRVELMGGNSTVVAGGGSDTIYSGDAGANWASSEANGNNYISGGSGNTTLFGSAGNDTLISGSQSGTNQATVIYGGNGNEYMVGGGGNDTIIGGSGNDTIYTGEGTTIVNAGIGATTINGGSGDMVVTLSAAASETSVVYGGNGNNKIFGGKGNDTIYTGDGNTLVDLSAVQLGGNATVNGGNGSDTIIGGSGNYLINAGDGTAVVVAGSGNTEIDGGAGSDQIYGGSGTDTLVAGSGDTTLYGGSGTQFMHAGDGNSTLIAGRGDDTLYGGSGTDVLQGTNGITQFVAGTGSETIIGGTGPNTYEFDSGFGNVELQHASIRDTFKFGAGISVSDLSLSTTTGSDGNIDVVISDNVGGGSIVLDGGTDGTNAYFAFADGTALTRDDLMAQYGVSSTVAGADGNLVFSPTANDTLTAGTGNDTLFGWSGGDIMMGGTGNDTFVVNHADTVVQAVSTGTNVNTIQASVSYTASANVQNLTGAGKSAITLTGNDMNNVITANSGNDTLVAGSGVATLVGGTGNDTFVVNNSADVVQAQFHTSYSGWTATSNTNTVLTSVSYAAPANVQVLTGTGSGDISLSDSNYNVTITANGGNDTLVGGAGNDTFYGAAGRDTFMMGNGTGSDTVIDASAQGGVIQLQDGLSLSNVLVGKVGNDLVIQSMNNPNDAMTVKGYYANPQASWTIQDATGAQMAVPTDAPTADTAHALAAMEAERNYISQAKERLGNYFAFQSIYSPFPVLQPDGTYAVDPASQNHPPITTWETVTTANGQTATYVPPAGANTTYANMVWNGYWYGPPVITPVSQGQYLGGGGKMVPPGMMNGGAITDYYFGYYRPVTYSQSGPAQPFSTQSASQSSWPTTTPGIAQRTDAINVYSTMADTAVVKADPQLTASSSPVTMWQPMQWDPVWSVMMATPPGYSLVENTSQVAPGYFSVDSLQVTQYYSRLAQYTQYQGTPAGSLLTDPGTLTTTDTGGQPPQAIAVPAGQADTTYNIQTISVADGGHTIYDETADTAYALRNWNDGPYYSSRVADRTIINAWSGDNTIHGGAVVYTGTGNDSVDNADTVYGGSGNDTITNSYEVHSGTGSDSIVAATKVYGGSGNDTIAGAAEVHSGSGNDLIDNSIAVYGGSGNDTITNSQFVRSGSGNDLLVNDGYVAAGSGNDTILGSWRVSIDPRTVGNELIGGPTTDQGYAVLNAFYQSQGISDWYARYTNPSSPASMQLAQTLQSYKTELTAQIMPEMSAAFMPSGFGSSGTTVVPLSDVAVQFNQLLANVQNAITSSGLPISAAAQSILNLNPATAAFVFGMYFEAASLSNYLQSTIADCGSNPPLPMLAVVDGSALQPSVNYAGSSVPVTHIAANDFAVIDPLMQSGYLAPDETISFGPGVSSSDLHFKWGEVTTTLSGSTTVAPSKYTTLNISWGTNNQSVQVIIPHAADPIGAALINFQFADGTSMSLGQMVALAPPQAFVFDPAMGNQTLPDGVTSIQFAAGIDPSQISVTQNASGNFVVSYNGGAATLTIPAADAISSPVVATFANNTTWQFVNANGGTYTYNAGSGVVYLINAAGVGTVQFGAGITSGMITLGLGSLMLRVGNGTGDVLHIEGFNPQDALNSGEIQTFKFADGTTLSYAQLLSRGFDIYGTTGNETLTGTNLDNRIYAGTGNDVMIGSGAHDTLYGGVGNETMIGGAGQELMIAGSGLTTMIGGTGTNTFVVNNTADVVQAQAGATNTIETSVSYTASANVQTLTGTGAADIVLTGNGIANVITANSGNDTLIAGSGVATLVGGAGNDTFVVNNTADVVQAQSTGTNVNTIETSVSYTASANVQNLVGIGSADIVLTGNNLANTITANSGNDTLIAGSGLATMVGGTGNDTFVVNNAADVVQAQSTGANVNTIETSVSYTASANVQNLVGIGSADIALTGNNLANTITANSGNDSLVAGTGVATMVGGVGNDTFYVNNVNDVVQAQSTGTNVNTVYTSVSYVAPANVANLIGTGAADIALTGNNLADTLVANSGNDTLIAGSGVATMVGGTGNDTFYVNNVSDVVQAQSTGSNVNTVYTSVSYVAPANVQNLIGIGSADITLTGNNLANTLVANSGNDTLIAGSGLATMVGGTGNDSFVVNNSADLINAQLTGSNVNTAYASVDFSLATNGQNVQNLVGTGTANLTLTGNSLNNTITANSGNDTLISISGNDTLISGTGVDTMIGGTGNDSFYVNNSADLINAQLTGANLNTAYASVSYDMATNAQNVQDLNGVGTADLILTGNSLNNVITANSGNDFINGGLGNDTLIGGTGANVLEDTSGNNVLTDTQGKGLLYAGAGADTLTGGGGNSFFAGGAGNDIVAPGAFGSVVAFNVGDGADTVMTAAGGANTLSLGGAIKVSNLALERNGNDLILCVSPSDSITFHDWYASTANADFTTLQIIGPQNANVLGGRLSGYANEFDFSQVVAAFDKQTANKPPLSPWNMTAALVQAHLSSSNTAALGGDLAYYYGSQGSLSGMNLAAAQTTLKDPAFGTQAQTLSTLSSVQGGTVTL